MKQLIMILILLMSIIVTNLAGSVSVQSGVDKSVINIGDYFKYYIIIKYSKDIKIVPPPPGANLGQFDIKDYNVIELKNTEDGLLQKKIEYTITTYFLGEFEIPPVEIEYIDKDKNRGLIKSEPMLIKIVPVKRKPDDKDDIRDLKSPMFVKTYTIYYILGLLLGVSVIGYFIYKYLSRKPEKLEREEKEIPREPEDVEALTKIEELLNKGYIESKQLKQFYFELSEILREYLHRRYSIATLERTSSEILTDLQNIIYNKDLLKKFNNFFFESDMVKFAKYIPTKNELNSIVPLAKELITKSRRIQSPT